MKYPDSTNSGTTTAYIDSTSDADVVSHSYNAQGQETRKKDQAGNILESDYDLSGRLIARKATTIDADFDDEVQLIQTTYDSLGRRETVTQRASTSVDGSGIANGTVIDQVKYLYDGWGNVTNFRQDLDSAVGGSGYREVAYTYAKATNGRNTIRRADMTLPDGTNYDFFYRGGNWHDEEASRVTTIKDFNDSDIVNYDYNGVGQVVRTQYDEVDVFSKAYNGTGTTFSALDRFDRTIISRWTKALTPNRNFYKVDIGYDENSNITYQGDGVHTGHDVLYTNDDLNRLIGAEEGTLAGGPPPTSITSRTRNQIWGLNQTGNWNTNLVDLNGDNDGADTDELNESRTHNAVNELAARDIDSDTSDDFSLAYDEVGNMIDDGEDYEYVWDVFGRLREVYVRNTSPAKSDLVSEYRYNGLGYLVSRHQDTDTDGDVDGSDVTFESVFDERWRAVATYRSGDSDPKELFLHHAAGASGFGGSSYIDHVVLRDRDATNGWAGAADGTLEERVYYCQNWRADVVALIDGSGGMLEWVKYSAYGVPFGLPAKDADSDGDYDSADDTAISGWGAYDVRGDVNLDGLVDGGDTATLQALGRGMLTSSDVNNRIGYAGYVVNSEVTEAMWHARHRIIAADIGRWLSRDPIGYSDSVSLTEAMKSNAASKVDSTGLFSMSPGGASGAASSAGGVSLAHGKIPGCPELNPDSGVGGVNNADHWCRDTSGGGHCDLTCYRSYDTGTRGGQQCCYNADGTLNKDVKCMGTIDLVGGAVAETPRDPPNHTDGGVCQYNWFRAWDHYWEDVRPYQKCPDKYNELQECLRNKFGVPSGGGPTPEYPDGVTDAELGRAYSSCKKQVDPDDKCGF